MKPELVDILACPVCLASPLQLKVSRQQNGEVISGTLSCPSCGKEYPIEEKIPRMIPQSGEAATRKMAGHEVEAVAADNKEVARKHYEVRQANIAYHDIAANIYEQDVGVSLSQNKFNQERVERVIRDLSQKGGGQRFLDIGCGTGNVLKFGKKYFQYAVGIDASVNMLKLANERGLEVIQADASFLPFTSDTFDVVSAFSVLHHIYDPSPVINEAGRVLDRQGILYSDWDPQKVPDLTSNPSLRLVNLAFYYLKKLKLQKEISDSEILETSQGNFRKDHPELKELYTLAEYHEQSKERGLDPALLQRLLLDAGFKSVGIKNHWHGKSFEDLKLNFLQRLEFKLKSKLSKQPIDRFMENIMIIAQK